MCNVERAVDGSLVRHIYDNFCIVREKGADVSVLKHLVQECIEQDIERYGTNTLNSASHLLKN